MNKILIYSSIFFLQAALVKECASVDKQLVEESTMAEKNIVRESEALKSAYKITEADTKVLNQASEALTSVEKNKIIANEFSLVKSEKIEKIKEITEHSLDLINEHHSDFSTNIYVSEIVKSNNFLPLCKMIRYKFKKDDLNNDQITSLLNGNKIDTIQFKPSGLFKIYYMYSKKFSEKILTEITLRSNCDKEKLKQISQIAEKKGIPTDSKLFEFIKKCN
jgi:hypothetical protein